MKRFIVCFVLAISIMLGLCACQPTTTDEQGVERNLFNGQFAVIAANSNDGSFIVYDISTRVVYYFGANSYNSYLSPYLIYQNGALYGTIFQDGEIVPVPYTYAPLE